MLPKYLNSRYRRYKADTTRFTTWLVRTAASCGANITHAVGVEGTQKIPLRSYDTLVDAIANAGIWLPESIRVIADRAVSLRKQCSTFFQTTIPENRGSNTGHDHFISVLESAIRRLTAKSTARNTDGIDETAPSAVPGAQATGKDEFVDLANRFSAIAMEEDFSDDMIVQPNQKLKKKATDKERLSIQHFDVDDQYDEQVSEPLFAAYCLFLDLNGIRGFVKETWQEYSNGRIDAMSAAVTTNSAMVLGRDLIEQFLSSPYSMSPGFRDTSKTLFSLVCLHRGEDLSVRQRSKDPFNLAVQDVAEWTLLITTLLLETFVPVIQSGLNVPFYQRGSWSVVDFTKPYNERSNTEKLDHDWEVLLDVLPEFVFLHKAKVELWLEDEFTRDMMNMVKTKKPSMSQAFSAQVLLDTHNTLGTKKAVLFNELRITALRAKKNLTSLLHFSAKTANPQWGKSHDESLRKLIDHIDDTIIHDGSLPVKIAMSKHGYNPVEFHLLKENPILCGLIMYDLNLRMQDVGLNITNGWGAVLPVLYLYSLIEITPAVAQVNWPDLDEFLKLHDEATIFVGGRPQNLEESFKKLSLSVGISATKLAKGGCRTKTSLFSAKGPRAVTSSTVLSSAFHEALRKDRSLQISAAIVGRLLECLETEPALATALFKSPNNATALQLLNHKRKKMKTLGPLQLLSTMRNRLANEEQRLLFNYIGLHERCFEFLGLLRDHLHEKLVQYNGKRYLEHEYQLPSIVSYVMEAAIHSAGLFRNKGMDSQAIGSMMILRSANQIVEYTKLKGDIACKELNVFSKQRKLIAANAKPEEKKKKQKQAERYYLTSIEDMVDPQTLALMQYGSL